jgi:hypothetical protein
MFQEMRLFFLTIPKPLKQYTLFKKDYLFRFPYRCLKRRRKLIIMRCECLQGVFFRVATLAEWLRHFVDLAVGGDPGARNFFAEERGGGRNANVPPWRDH